MNLADDLKALMATKTNPDSALKFALIQILKIWNQGRGQIRASVPIRCPKCQAYSLALITNITRTHIFFECSIPHVFKYPIPLLKNLIQGSHSRRPKLLSFRELRVTIRRHDPAWWKWANNLQFKDIPKGYLKPKTLFLLTAFAFSEWDDHENFEARRIMLIVESWNPFPLCVYVNESLVNACLDSPHYREDLANIRPAFQSGTYFFAGLVIGSKKFSFLSFRLVEEGWHDIKGVQEGFYTPTRKLLLWLPLLDTAETYTAEVTMAGNLRDLQFDLSERKPLHEHAQVIIKTFVHLWLILNEIQQSMDRTPVPKQSGAYRKKPYKQRKSGPTAIKTRRLGFVESDLYGERPSNDGQPVTKLAPHWKSGHEQRYHFKDQNGKTLIRWLWKLPYPVNQDETLKPYDARTGR